VAVAQLWIVRHHMNTPFEIKSSLPDDTKLRGGWFHSWWFRYGFLAAVLVLVVHGLIADLFAAPNSEKHLVVFIPLLLLFNHLAFSFRWSRGMTLSLQVFALLWLLFVGVYTFMR
jgi:hypothetical protein